MKGDGKYIKNEQQKIEISAGTDHPLRFRSVLQMNKVGTGDKNTEGER